MALKERVEEAKRIALQEIKVNENRIHGFPAMAERAWGLITYFQEEELKRKNKRKFASEDNESAVKNKIGKIQHKKKGKGRRQISKKCCYPMKKLIFYML